MSEPEPITDEELAEMMGYPMQSDFPLLFAEVKRQRAEIERLRKSSKLDKTLCSLCGNRIDGTVYARGKARLHRDCWGRAQSD